MRIDFFDLMTLLGAAGLIFGGDHNASLATLIAGVAFGIVFGVTKALYHERPK